MLVSMANQVAPSVERFAAVTAYIRSTVVGLLAVR